MVDILEVLHDEKSRMNFMHGLINLAKAAENREGSSGINTEEMCFLKNAMLALNLSDYVQRELESIVRAKENIVNISFENKRQALFFLREGIQICYIEGQYQKAEKEMIQVMASMLEVSQNAVETLEQWAKEGIEWSNRGDNLLGMEA